jgi:capsular exopolysaccharide synthesis family protein
MEDKALNSICEYLRKNYGTDYATITRRDLRGMLNITVDNQIVVVKVVSTDKKVTLDVATAVQNTVPASMDYYFGVVNTEGVEMIESVAKAITMASEENVTEVGRNTGLYALLGFGIGMILVYVFCVLRTYFDNTIYSEDDLKNLFEIPVIGQIPTWENTKVGEKAFKDKSRHNHFKGGKDSTNADSGNLMSDRDYAGRLLNKKTPFAITEAFKTLRTNMCYTTKGEKCAIYGITSAYVSAGKSLIISNMAISYAQMNKKVLLVDGDLRCPVIHKIFSLDNKVNGMSDVLAGICTYEELYRRNGGYENLNIITSGKIPPNPAELLASANMKQFIATVKEEYDVVLIDLPPICEVSDAGIVSDLVTGFTFVVRSGYSDRRMISHAVESMEGFGANLSGFILNDIDIKSGDYYKNKYYSNYSKYRFRTGKSGYYRHFKYGYYKGYYSRYGYSRYSRYSRYGNYGTNSYSSSYSRAHEEANAETELLEEENPEILNDAVENEILETADTAATYEETFADEDINDEDINDEDINDEDIDDEDIDDEADESEEDSENATFRTSDSDETV